MSQNPYYQDPQYQPSYAQQPQGPYGQPYQPGAYTAVPEKKPEPSTVVKTGIYLGMRFIPWYQVFTTR
mgnify:CR=1 FL=1